LTLTGNPKIAEYAHVIRKIWPPPSSNLANWLSFVSPSSLAHPSSPSPPELKAESACEDDNLNVELQSMT